MLIDVTNIKWHDLQEHKEELLKHINLWENYMKIQATADALKGIVCLIERIQDEVIDTGYETEEEVLGWKNSEI